MAGKLFFCVWKTSASRYIKITKHINKQNDSHASQSRTKHFCSGSGILNSLLFLRSSMIFSLRMEISTPLQFAAPTTNVTQSSPGESQEETMTIKIVRIVGYLVLFIFGVFGNSMVILAVRKPRMKTVTNVLIANLGLADLLVALFNIPSVVTYAHLWQWPFGEVLCKVLPFLQGLTLCASVGTLLGIALDRYWHIVHFKRRKITLKEAYKILTLIWVSSIIIPMPLLIFCKILTVAQNGFEYVLCEEVWPNLASRQTYTMVLFLVLYLFPLMAISILYFVIARSLRRQPSISSSLEGKL